MAKLAEIELAALDRIWVDVKPPPPKARKPLPALESLDTAFFGRFFLTSHDQIDQEVLSNTQDMEDHGEEKESEAEELQTMSMADLHKLGVVL